MIEFAKRSLADRGGILAEVAGRRGLITLVVEKDFWACFALDLLFRESGFGEHLVFKGGTSLSKAHRLIDRFSEDLDISISPDWIVDPGKHPESAQSKSERARRFEALQAACTRTVRERIEPVLERSARRHLGPSSLGESYFEFTEDTQTQSPVLLFRYPTREILKAGYIEPRIKLEFGSLTGQRPIAELPVTP